MMMKLVIFSCVIVECCSLRIIKASPDAKDVDISHMEDEDACHNQWQAKCVKKGGHSFGTDKTPPIATSTVTTSTVTTTVTTTVTITSTVTTITTTVLTTTVLSSGAISFSILVEQDFQTCGLKTNELHGSNCGLLLEPNCTTRFIGKLEATNVMSATLFSDTTGSITKILSCGTCYCAADGCFKFYADRTMQQWDAGWGGLPAGHCGDDLDDDVTTAVPATRLFDGFTDAVIGHLNAGQGAGIIYKGYRPGPTALNVQGTVSGACAFFNFGTGASSMSNTGMKLDEESCR